MKIMKNHIESHWITLRDDLGRCRVAITRFDMEILGVLRNRALWKWFPNDQHQTLGISAYFDIFRIYILHSCDKTLPALFLLVTSHNLSIFESYPSDWLVTSLVSMVFIPAIQGRNGECSFFFIHIVDYLGKKTHWNMCFSICGDPNVLGPSRRIFLWMPWTKRSSRQGQEWPQMAGCMQIFGFMRYLVQSLHLDW